MTLRIIIKILYLKIYMINLNKIKEHCKEVLDYYVKVTWFLYTKR